jgi:hypothetical protein
MAQILQFVRPFDVFDADTLILLGRAYDQALASLHDRGQPRVVREAIAIRMFDLVSSGERDIDRLCQRALGPVLSQKARPGLIEVGLSTDCGLRV